MPPPHRAVGWLRTPLPITRTAYSHVLPATSLPHLPGFCALNIPRGSVLLPCCYFAVSSFSPCTFAILLPARPRLLLLLLLHLPPWLPAVPGSVPHAGWTFSPAATMRFLLALPPLLTCTNAQCLVLRTLLLPYRVLRFTHAAYARRACAHCRSRLRCAPFWVSGFMVFLHRRAAHLLYTAPPPFCRLLRAHADGSHHRTRTGSSARSFFTLPFIHSAGSCGSFLHLLPFLSCCTACSLPYCYILTLPYLLPLRSAPYTTLLPASPTFCRALACTARLTCCCLLPSGSACTHHCLPLRSCSHWVACHRTHACLLHTWTLFTPRLPHFHHVSLPARCTFCLLGLVLYLVLPVPAPATCCHCVFYHRCDALTMPYTLLLRPAWFPSCSLRTFATCLPVRTTATCTPACTTTATTAHTLGSWDFLPTTMRGSVYTLLFHCRFYLCCICCIYSASACT